MRLAKITLVSTVLLGMSLSLGWCADAMKDIARDEWMNVYFGKTKVGYMHTTVTKDKYKDKDAYKKDQTVSLTLDAEAGQKTQLESATTLYVNDKFAPIYSISKIAMKQTGKDAPKPQAVSLETTYGEKQISLKVQTPDGKVTDQSVDIPKGTDLVNACMYELGTRKLTAGDKFDVAIFRMQNLAIEQQGLRFGFSGAPSAITVLTPAKVDVGGKTYDATPVVDKEESIETKKWFTASGELIKTENSTGVTLVKTTREDALKAPEPPSTPAATTPATTTPSTSTTPATPGSGTTNK